MEEILQHIHNNNLDEAIRLLKERIAKEPKNEEAHFVLGNVYRKMEDWKDAINSYLKAEEINPDSPARNARLMILDILNYYNKDLYNP